MPHYLVTGGCGFIGSNLVRKLVSDGHSVTVLDNLSTGNVKSIPDSVTVIEDDVSDSSAVLLAFENGVDGCFHLAANPSVAQSIEDYPGCHRTNLGGTISVFDSAIKYGKSSGQTVPVIYASSCAVYGNEKTLPLRESISTSPLSSYGVDKLCGELHARMAASAYGLSSIGLRFFNVYGPGQNPNSAYSGVLTLFCEALVSNKPVTIFGDGLQERDFVYVDDVVSALRRAMDTVEQRSPGVYNVCTGNGLTLLDVGKTIADICEVSFDPQFTSPRTGDVRYSIGCPALCMEELDWSCSTDLEYGLRKTIDWLVGQDLSTSS